MAFIAAVQTSFGGDTKELSEKSGEATGIVSKFAENVREMLGEVGTSFLKAFALERVLEQLKELVVQAFENAEKLQNLARELDVSTTSLQSFNFVVRETGGSSETAQKAWERLRLALDQLGDGQKTATEAFEKLGLSARELEGLSLDDALEKVAKAYEESSDKAGAYAAITEILGRRNAPQLMVALRELAENGWAGVNKEAEHFGQVVNPDSINTLAATVRGLGVAWNYVKTGVSELFADIIRLGESIDALAIGDIRALKEVWASRNEQIAVTEKKISESAIATAEALAQSKALMDDRRKDYEAELEAVASVAKGKEKIVALEMVQAQLAEDANADLLSKTEMIQLENKYRAVGAEIKKTELEIEQKQTAEIFKDLDAYEKLYVKVEEMKRVKALEVLPVEERINVLNAERAKIVADMAKYDQDSKEYLNDYVKLNNVDKEIEKEKLELIKQQAAAAKAAHEAKMKAITDEYNAEHQYDLGLTGQASNFGGVSIAPHYTADQLSSASDAVLGEIIRRAQAEIDQLEATKFSSAAAGAEVATNFLTRSTVEGAIGTDIALAQQELARRNAARSTDYNSALASYAGDPLKFDQFFQQATQGLTAQQQTAIDVQSIAQTLKKIAA